MQIKKPIFYVGCFWEVLRFVLLFSLVSILLNPRGNLLYTLYLLWVSAPFLVIPVLYFLVAFKPENLTLLRPMLLYGKVLELVPVGFLLLFLKVLPPHALERTRWDSFSFALSIGVIDFLFFLFLLFYYRQQES
ncbi:MAG: hypothetical protein SNJ78_12485 [Spirochaetales bacterium]